jgi:CheY-like chemotaxis protein
VVDAAGPLSETRRTTSDGADVGDAVEEVREAAAAARRARVLLAGVDPNTRAIARVALGDRVDVREAATAGAVLEAAREGRPDLVILDWQGAGQPAVEVVGALREDPVTRESKVLLVVDYRESASREVIASGADERLSTPFSPLQLQVKLRRLLGAEVIGG